MLVIVTTFATTTVINIDMFGNHSRQTQHLSNCRAARLSWKPHFGTMNKFRIVKLRQSRRLVSGGDDDRSFLRCRMACLCSSVCLRCEYSRCLLNLSSPLVFLCPFALYNARLSSAFASAVVSSAHDPLGCTRTIDYAVSCTIARTIYRIPVIYAVYLLWNEQQHEPYKDVL